MLREAYRAIMDENVNAFRSLPRTVRFQLMTVLSFMWSSIFTIWIGWTWLLGPSVAAHLLLLAGIVFTADQFRPARPRILSYDETFRDPRDGCARYDDVWGAP
jgi:hypothetical protein